MKDISLVYPSLKHSTETLPTIEGGGIQKKFHIFIYHFNMALRTFPIVEGRGNLSSLIVKSLTLNLSHHLNLEDCENSIR